MPEEKKPEIKREERMFSKKTWAGLISFLIAVFSYLGSVINNEHKRNVDSQPTMAEAREDVPAYRYLDARISHVQGLAISMNDDRKKEIADNKADQLSQRLADRVEGAEARRELKVEIASLDAKIEKIRDNSDAILRLLQQQKRTEVSIGILKPGTWH